MIPRAVAFALILTGGWLTAAAVQEHDLVIVNARVLDPESGLDAVRNVGVRGGSIAAIDAAPLRGQTDINATGLVLAPGFIDLHRHGQDEENYRYAALDGVTSVFELEVGTADVDRWYRERAPGRLVNHGVAIGHIPVRMAVMGDAGDFLPSGPAASEPASDEQVEEMARRIEEGLLQGAVAVGFGTAYTPAASSWEVLEMFRVAGRHGAPAHIHVRRGTEGVQEALANAVVTSTPLHIVHINSTGGNNVGCMLTLIDEAQRRGIDVTTEVYPYNRGSTRIESSLYDNWERLSDEGLRAESDATEPTSAHLGRAREALLGAGRLADATVQFEKIVTSGSEHARQPLLYVRSFYHLGTLYEQRGDARRRVTCTAASSGTGGTAISIASVSPTPSAGSRAWLPRGVVRSELG